MIIAEFRHGQICLHLSHFVQPLSVGDNAHVSIDVCGQELVQEFSGIFPHDSELVHETHIEESDAVTARVRDVWPTRTQTNPLD
jgi:hypothetical protein